MQCCVVVAMEARLYGKIRLNTKRLRPGEALDNRLVHELAPIGRRFWPGACGLNNFEKEECCSDERRRFAKGDPSGIV
jgi:hypothetical protein